MAEKQMNYFETLNNVNVSDKTEKKNGLTYLSWSFSWGELKKRFPDAIYTIYENAEGWNYHTDGRTAWVKTGVTVNGIEHIEYLPVMDFRNKSIPLDKVTSMDVNKTIQRSLTKAVARHGLGLYVYAGEDLPEEEKPGKEDPVKEAELKSRVMGYFNRHKLDKEKLDAIAKHYKVENVKDLTGAHCADYINSLKAKGVNVDE